MRGRLSFHYSSREREGDGRTGFGKSGLSEAQPAPWRARIHWTRTLRNRLTATVAGTLLVILALLAVAWEAANSAGQVVEEAARIHQRTQAYSRLQVAADELQRAAYAAVRVQGPTQEKILSSARSEYDAALAGVLRLPVQTERENALRDKVGHQGNAVRALFSSAGQVVSAVDRSWQDAGSNAALQEVDRLSAPYFVLVNTITEEIRLGDRELRAATDRAGALRTSLALVGVIGFFLSAMFAGLSLMLVLTRLSPGLKALEDGVRSVGQEGAQPEKIAMHGHDELARLAGAFNVMTDRLQAQQAELRNISSGLERAVSERTAELARVHHELEDQDRKRREFIAEISHELRTPIAIIRGETQVAQRALCNSGHVPPAALERILAQTRHLGRLVNDLFLLAKAEAGGLELHRERLDLGQLAAEVATDFDPIIAAKNGTCRQSLAQGVVVDADRDRLRQIVAALLDNALRHTQPGVSIELTLEVDTEGKAILAVRDDGPGVDEETLARLFSRFQRGRGNSDGSGLGLSIVKALAEAHGGKAVLRSQFGQGFEATITLQSVRDLPARLPGSESVENVQSAGR